jgi:hypothetical protein
MNSSKIGHNAKRKTCKIMKPSKIHRRECSIPQALPQTEVSLIFMCLVAGVLNTASGSTDGSAHYRKCFPRRECSIPQALPQTKVSPFFWCPLAGVLNTASGSTDGSAQYRKCFRRRECSIPQVLPRTGVPNTASASADGSGHSPEYLLGCGDAQSREVRCVLGMVNPAVMCVSR